MADEQQKYCDELQQFIQETDAFVKDFCSQVGWDLNKIIEHNKHYITCPFNEGHSVPENSIQKHLETCEWKSLGYTKECIPLPEPVLPLDSPSTIKFDMQLQQKVLMEAKQKYPLLEIGIDEKLIPQTSDRLMSDFTRDERKAMYEYVVSNTIAPDIGRDITDINKPEKSNEQSTPYIELLAQERNLKRRRVRHRGVHTNKKSHTEILRELVEQQMEMYKEYITEKFGISNFDTAEQNSHKINNNKDSKLKLKDDDVNSSSKHENQKNISEDTSPHNHKSKPNSSRFDYESDRSSKYYKQDHSSKHTSHYKSYDYKNSSRDQSYRDFSGRYDNYERDRNKYDYHDKNRKKSDCYDKPSDKNVTRSRKRDRSKSKERRYEEKTRDDSKSRKSHKKHKKDYKKKKNKSHDNDDDHKHKSDKHKHYKHRSRSRS